jgi:excisionase family DNA binding protein
VNRTTESLDRRDLVEDEVFAPREEGAAIDHHVDLVGACGNRLRGIGELDVEIDEAAARLGLCVDTIYDAIREKALPHKRIGRRIFIVRDKLIAWLCE